MQINICVYYKSINKINTIISINKIIYIMDKRNPSHTSVTHTFIGYINFLSSHKC